MVLIITHDKRFAEHIERLLRQKDYPVTLASGGEEGLNRAKQLSPELVVLDMYLKGPCSSDVLQSLREQGFNGKIILLAGLSVSPLVPGALRFGIEHVIGEPLTLGSLECAIQSALGTYTQEKLLHADEEEDSSVFRLSQP